MTDLRIKVVVTVEVTASTYVISRTIQPLQARLDEGVNQCHKREI
jgi:hypothetical protein